MVTQPIFPAFACGILALRHNGRAFPLSHLHPFRYALAVSIANQPVAVDIHVAFALHCFTRKRQLGDDASRLYSDPRETRIFCPDRYAQSFKLPDIARRLADISCRFARNDNYVTLDVQTLAGAALRYGVFFNVRQAGNERSGAVLLTIQSAYLLDAVNHEPGRGSIKFRRLVELTLLGVKPRPPSRR